MNVNGFKSELGLKCQIVIDLRGVMYSCDRKKKLLAILKSWK